jgi:thiamine-phosphate pyrophosphorylase
VRKADALRATRGVYAVTPEDLVGPALLRAVEAALRGGVAIVQYRAKHHASIEDARAVTQLCHRHGVTAIVNDDPDLARAAGADGVHLGAGDPDVATARAVLGPARVIGLSCYDRLDRALAGAAAGADYVAFGSFFASPTKPGAARPSTQILREARRQLLIPIVAIGGITADNGRSLLDHGADWLAVSSGIFATADPERAARACVRLFDQ